MEHAYGVKGLSKYAEVRYNPKGAYGDVYGSMDLSSENDLVKAVIASYMRQFDEDGITRGGIGLDNAGKVPREFLETLARRLNARGLGIAANGCPDEYLTYIDFFGNEGFPFSINYARRARQSGLRGILGEFTMQHLSGGEMDAYLKSKLFNRIVFFGYTNGGTAAGASYSGYCSRPDVYNHQRWVLRKLVPISRAVQRAGRQTDPAAKLASAAAPVGEAGSAPAGVAVNTEGKVEEVKRNEAGLDRITGRSQDTRPLITRYGRDVANGIYLFVDSGQPEEVVCDAQKLGVLADTLVFDEFAGRVLEAKRAAGALSFKTPEGPSVVQLASASTVAKSILARTAEGLRLQLTQRELDRQLGTRFPHKAWSRFCQAGKWDATVARTGKGSLAVVGGTYTATMPQWKYFNRQGAAQFVSLNQTTPQPILVRAFSKAQEVANFRAGRPRHPGRAPTPLRRARGPCLLHAPLPGLPRRPVARGAHRALLARHPRLGGEEHPCGAHPPGEDSDGAAGIPSAAGCGMVRRPVALERERDRAQPAGCPRLRGRGLSRRPGADARRGV